MQYFSTVQKWESLRDGCLAQRLPSFVPGREYISTSRANTLRIPRNKKDALITLGLYESTLDQDWIGNDKVFYKQKDKIVAFLNLGAYCLPKLVLESDKIDMHVRDSLKKDLARCMNDLRRGILFHYRHKWE